jgi:lipocalin-like protein
MTRLSTLGSVVFVIVGMSLLPGNVAGQQKTIKEQLLGTWVPVSWEQDTQSGPKFQRFGAAPKGIHMFGNDGRFVVMFARADLPKIAANDPSKPTPEEARAIAAGSIAYFGTYAVDEGAKTISFRIESSTYPNQLGVDQKRTITSLSPTELKYVNTSVVGGGPNIHVTMKRAD